LDGAVRALSACIEADIAVGVQSVATKKNANDLPALGDKLFRLGVRSWRILKVAPASTNLREYGRLVGERTDSGKRVEGRRRRGPYEFVFQEVLRRQRSSWGQRMAVQVTKNDIANAVILIGPDGTFYTESNTGQGKIVLDEMRPRRPSLSLIARKVDMLAHTARYLNLTSQSVLADMARGSEHGISDP
jgi:hypothetical protein